MVVIMGGTKMPEKVDHEELLSRMEDLYSSMRFLLTMLLLYENEVTDHYEDEQRKFENSL